MWAIVHAESWAYVPRYDYFRWTYEGIPWGVEEK